MSHATARQEVGNLIGAMGIVAKAPPIQAAADGSDQARDAA
jgi:hypothetical protein